MLKYVQELPGGENLCRRRARRAAIGKKYIVKRRIFLFFLKKKRKKENDLLRIKRSPDEIMLQNDDEL